MADPLATRACRLESIGWYNAARLHESLGDIPLANTSSTKPNENRVRSL
jgi:hypothetical protein